MQGNVKGDMVPSLISMLYLITRYTFYYNPFDSKQEFEDLSSLPVPSAPESLPSNQSLGSTF